MCEVPKNGRVIFWPILQKLKKNKKLFFMVLVFFGPESVAAEFLKIK